MPSIEMAVPLHTNDSELLVAVPTLPAEETSGSYWLHTPYLLYGLDMPLLIQTQGGLADLRFQDFFENTFFNGRLSASRTGRLYPQGYSWYSFSLGAELTPGPWFSRKEICH